MRLDCWRKGSLSPGSSRTPPSLLNGPGCGEMTERSSLLLNQDHIYTVQCIRSQRSLPACMRMPKNCCRKSQELVIDRSAKLAIVATSHPSAARSGRIFYRLQHLPRHRASPPGHICCRLFRLRNVDLKRWLPPEPRLQPQTTNIYNDYMGSLPLHAKGGGCVVGKTRFR